MPKGIYEVAGSFFSQKSIHAMDYVKLLFVAALFYALTPGVLLSLPPGASHHVKAATHGVVFAVALAFAWPAFKKAF